ncbi:MAG: hypothetical protein ACXVB0_11065 [Mucilaginibacter sp.]
MAVTLLPTLHLPQIQTDQHLHREHQHRSGLNKQIIQNKRKRIDGVLYHPLV